MNGIGALAFVAEAVVGVVMLCIPRTRRAGALIVAVVVLWNGAIIWREVRFVRGYDRVDVGATMAEVRSAMGTRSREGPATDETGSATAPDYPVRGCVRELWYAQFWVPSQYALRFDKSDR